MRGLLLVNNRNSVVLCNGDSQFVEHLNEKINKELYESASTSSGVFTDSSEESANITARKMSGKDKHKFSTSQVSTIFLPLISLYRSSAAMSDAYETAVSDSARIQFNQLNNGFLLISICDRESQWDARWTKVITGALQLHFGPLIESVDTDLSVFDGAKRNLEQTISALASNAFAYSPGYLDVCASSFYNNSIQKLQPILKTLSSQLHQSLGTNRCLLVSNGNILASANSSRDEKKLWKYVSADDLCAIQQHVRTKSIGSAIDVSQYWMRSTISTTPFYVDVFRTRLTEHLELVCFSEAVNSKAIRMNAVLMERLGQLAADEIDPGCVDIIVKDLANLLCHDIQMRPNSRTPTAYTRNPQKTAMFIQQQWTRIMNEFNKLNKDEEESATGMRRFSMMTIKSTISLLSVSSATQTQCSDQSRLLPIRLETMVKYLKRQVQSLLHELCSNAQNEAFHYKVERLQGTISKVLKGPMEKMLQDCQIGDPLKESDMIESLKPTLLRLDMLAYCFTSHTTNMSISYVPDNFSGIFDEYPLENRETLKMMDLNYKGKSYFLMKIYFPAHRAERGWFTKPRKSIDNVPDECSITVLYHTFVHKQLATRQTQLLAKHLHGKVSSCGGLYC